MARPRKNRTGEYAQLFGEELSAQLQRQISKSISENQILFHEELAKLRTELRNLTRRVDALIRRGRTPRATLGRWVPGGPGRPPKDAATRIAAFEARTNPKAQSTNARAKTRAR